MSQVRKRTDLKAADWNEDFTETVSATAGDAVRRGAEPGLPGYSGA